MKYKQSFKKEVKSIPIYSNIDIVFSEIPYFIERDSSFMFFIKYVLKHIRKTYNGKLLQFHSNNDIEELFRDHLKDPTTSYSSYHEAIIDSGDSSYAVSVNSSLSSEYILGSLYYLNIRTYKHNFPIVKPDYTIYTSPPEQYFTFFELIDKNITHLTLKDPYFFKIIKN